MNVNLQKLEKLQTEYERLLSLERFDEAQMVKSQLNLIDKNSINQETEKE